MYVCMYETGYIVGVIHMRNHGTILAGCAIPIMATCTQQYLSPIERIVAPTPAISFLFVCSFFYFCIVQYLFCLVSLSLNTNRIMNDIVSSRLNPFLFVCGEGRRGERDEEVEFVFIYAKARRVTFNKVSPIKISIPVVKAYVTFGSQQAPFKREPFVDPTSV